jgi:hypothetical protein
MAEPAWSINFASRCPRIAGRGDTCQVCDDDATGHATVAAGPHDGRCLAVVCARHASEDGWPEVKDRLAGWAGAGLLDVATGGPGPHGEPLVWHRDHYDPMPSPGHDAAGR